MENLTPKMRVKRAIEHEDVDVVPVAGPFHGFWALGEAKISVKDAIASPPLAVKAQIEVVRQCGFDVVEAMWDWLSPIQTSGCKVRIPEIGDIPTCESIISGPNFLHKMEPLDPMEDKRFLSSLKDIDLINKKLGKDYYLSATLCCPFTMAGELRGVEALILDTLVEPLFANDMVRYTTDIIKAYCEILGRTKIDGVMLCDPTSSGSLIPKKDFDNFSKPSLIECGAVLKRDEKDLGLHICGDTGDRLESIAEIGGQIFSLDQWIDLAYVKKVIGLNQTLLGNIKTSDLLVESKEKIAQESLSCLKKTRGIGFILATGGDIVPTTSIENVRVMKETTIEFGPRRAKKMKK
jgi:MtaA/CmuA family methyltransferase